MVFENQEEEPISEEEPKKEEEPKNQNRFQPVIKKFRTEVRNIARVRINLSR